MLAIAAVVFLALARALGWAALFGPDAPFTAARGASDLLFFGAFTASVVGWGRLASRALGLDTHDLSFTIPALGTLALALLASFLGATGLIGTPFRPLLLALLLAGPLASPGFPKPARRGLSRRLSCDRLEGLVWLVIAAAVVTVFVSTFDPTAPENSDELRYHLLGPRLWWDAGRIGPMARYPLVMQAGLWDDLHLWANALLAGPAGGGLLDVELFARWTHLFFGFLGTGLALRALLRRTGIAPEWRALAVLAALSVPSLSATARTAKNDFGAMLWALSGATLLLTTEAKERRARFAAGLLLGGAVAAKLTTLFAVIAIGAFWFFGESRRRRARELVPLKAGAALALLPWLALQWSETGNPLFPSANGIFASPWLSPYWDDFHRLYVGGAFELSPARVLSQSWKLPLEVPLLPLAAGLLFLRVDRRLKLLVGASLAAFVAYLLKVASPFGEGLRLLGLPLALLAAAAVLAVARVRLKQAWARPLLFAALVAVFCWRSVLPWPLWSELDRFKRLDRFIRENMVGGPAKAWLREHAAPDDLILSTGDNQMYYLEHLNFTVLPEQPELACRFYRSSDPVRILRAARLYGGVYLLDTRHYQLRAWGPVAALLQRLIFAHPETVLFLGRESQVVDLARLEGEVLRACPAPARVAPPGFGSCPSQSLAEGD